MSRILKTVRPDFSGAGYGGRKSYDRGDRKIASQGDSTGGILETAVTGLPAGAGEPWFDTVESVIAHGIFLYRQSKGSSLGQVLPWQI